MTAPVAQTGAGNVVTNSTASASSIAANKPANVADGDLLVAAVFFRNASGTVTPPSGWALLGTLNTTNETFGLYYKYIPTASGEAATSYSFSTTGGASRNLIIIFRVTGAVPSSPQDAAGALAAYTGTTSVVDPAVTAVDPESLLLAFNIANTSTGSQPVFTAPAGMTEVGQITVSNATPASSSIQVAQQALSSSGSTGTRTFTMSPAATNSGGIMVTIRAPATGSAAFTGAGTLTASGALGAAGSAAFTGVGTLTAGPGKLGAIGAVAFTGAGTLAIDSTEPYYVMRDDGTWAPITKKVMIAGTWVP